MRTTASTATRVWTSIGLLLLAAVLLLVIGVVLYLLMGIQDRG
jgi:hypothetical protein